MYYIEYHELLKKYKEASRRYNEAIEEGGRLITSVLPKASQFKDVITFGGNISPDAKLIAYTSKIDEINNLIAESKNMRNTLKEELEKMELELKNSDYAQDRIYYYRWIKRMSPYKFNKIIGYSKSQVYNYIAEIKKNLYKNKELDKIGQI